MTNQADVTILNQFTHEQISSFLKKQSEVNYSFFVEELIRDIKEIIQKLESNREAHFESSEDNITNFICTALSLKGYDATEQTKQNGDVDLTVVKHTFKWIAEAKIGITNDKILEGLLQLLTRYVARDTNCGLLVYIKKSNINKSIKDWQQYITDQSIWTRYVSKKKEITKQDIEKVLNNVSILDVDNISFKSKHTLVSGFPIEVNNFFINLYHNPTDTSGNKSYKHRKIVAREKLAQLYFENINSDVFNAVMLKNILADLFCDYDPDDVEQII